MTPVSSSWSAARATRCGTVSILTSCPTTRTPDGCQPTQVVRAGRSTDAHIAGSKEHYDRAMETAVSLMRDLAGDLPQPSTEQSTEVFEVRGIVIPRGDIVIYPRSSRNRTGRTGDHAGPAVNQGWRR